MDCPYLYLTNSIRDEDERQDACAALLSHRPATEEDAKGILRRVHYRAENNSRKQPLQFYATPTGEVLEPLQDQSTPAVCGIHDAITRLPESERDLVHLRYISGMTVRQIAAEQGRSVSATHEALTLAVDKLKVLLK